MNIVAYNSDTLREIVRKLEKENKDLKKKLMELQIPFESEDIFNISDSNNSYEIDQGGRIIPPRYINEKMVNLYLSMFNGRRDVYAKRGSKGGYYPQCANRWTNSCPKQKDIKFKCSECDRRNWMPLDNKKVLLHLLGYKEDCSDVIGIYPLLPNQTCNFLVFDFDQHDEDTYNNEWKDEVDALRKICVINGITPLVERSRSGNGAHVWIFFSEPVSALKARNFGSLLLEKGASDINLRSFKYYDRMFPSQDSTNDLGNLIALPLQGQALLNGNSAFVDENWNAYQNQWDILLRKTPKLSISEIDGYMMSWKQELILHQASLFENDAVRPKPWKQDSKFHKEDVNGKLHIVLSDGIYIDTLNIMPRLQNKIRAMAAFDNPEYYKNKNLGISNYKTYSVVYLGEDVNGYIKIPRGLREELIDKCNKAKIEMDIQSEQVIGKPIRVAFNGKLQDEQDIAVVKMLQEPDGILNAATSFGKTVVCNYLIAQKKVNTLIILQSGALVDQWKKSLHDFLMVDEPLPEYKTKTGKIKKRKDIVGVLRGATDTRTNIVDITMAQTLVNREDIDEILNSYGMILLDECHHAASKTYVNILKRVKSKYLYGVSATLHRSDKLDQIIPWMIAPIRHQYTARQRVEKLGIPHIFVPRYTKVVDLRNEIENVNDAYQIIRDNPSRNQFIISDVENAIQQHKNPIVLTKFKNHAKDIYEALKDKADHVLLIYGDSSEKENSERIAELKNTPIEESAIVIATGQKIGEGFDCSRLDTLFLATPVSHSGLIEQYVGRIARDNPNKEEVVVYDYVDSHIGYFDKMFKNRLRTYKRIGFQVQSNETTTIKNNQAIFNGDNYQETFEQNLIMANHSIVISSPELRRNKVERFMSIMEPRLECGVKVSVVTLYPEESLQSNANVLQELIYHMQSIGIIVILKEELNERFAVIDNDLIWHGGMNLLGKSDVNELWIPFHDTMVANELLEIVTKH